MPKEKREFDRRSGTGRGKEISKQGHGKGNWGTVDELIGVEADQQAGRPGPGKKPETTTQINGTRYLDEYKQSIGQSTSPQKEPVKRVRKKSGKMSLAEFQAQN
eukprot:CAMPEP_0197515524 /NCGR_PEP_ID=MMETSP1318-20131121/611_1 /TAXON_ID=552666 /ORGANISM="Partenskyella glossopodia, Strain RCC365" /LENGTH=103 /DNA_ID=CAMNT_0043063921 /DNA_START=61 /DNA_END=372 /DNA_ORIENTATION=-